jgi:hypothetical protein
LPAAIFFNSVSFFDSQRKQQEEEAQAKRNLRTEMDQSGREFCMAELVRYYSGLSNEQLVEAIATPASTDSQLAELQRWWNLYYRGIAAPFFHGLPNRRDCGSWRARAKRRRRDEQGVGDSIQARQAPSASSVEGDSGGSASPRRLSAAGPEAADCSTGTIIC